MENENNLPTKTENTLPVMREISEAQLDSLLTQLEEANAEKIILKAAAVSIMDLLGLLDHETQTIKKGIESGEDSFVPGMLKSLGDIVHLLTASRLPKMMGGEKAQLKLEQKFSFVKGLIPVINKHG